MRLDHINIAASMALLTATRDFYCDVVGLEEGPRPSFAFRGFWLYGEGQPIVHLMESDIHRRAEQPHHLDHVAFRMTDAKAYIKRLQAHLIEYKTKNIVDFKIAQIFCQDPCGNGVEINFANETIDL